MKTLRTAAVLLAVAVLFWIANRGAYQGYFSADDLNNLFWTSHSTPLDHLKGLFSPWYSNVNYRPTGHFIFQITGQSAGLNFLPYVWLIQLLHLTNVFLLWRVLLRLGAQPRAAAFAALVWSFHMALFDAFWKPMFVFDLLVCLFSLLTLLLYTSRFWLAALLTFWLAYKSKEMAVALPAFLALYEYWSGNRRWRRVAPFAAISIWFTAQALIWGQNYYSLVFTPQAIWQTLRFYSSELLFLPYAGLLLIPAFILSKDNRIRLGIAGAVVLMGPLWFLPGRMFSVYLYLPCAAFAIALAFVSQNRRAWVLLAAMALWIPANYMIMREKRKATLAAAEVVKPYVQDVERFHTVNPAILNVVSESRPEQLESWGVEAAFQWFYRSPQFKVSHADLPEGKALLLEPNLAIANWKPFEKQLVMTVRDPAAPFPAHFAFGEGAPIWALRDGFLWSAGRFWWTGVKASAVLHRPPGARFFEVTINVSPRQLADQGSVQFEAVVDGQPLGVRRFTTSGWLTQHWELKPAPAADVTIEIRFAAPYRPQGHQGEPLGAPVVAFGFVE
jgi:hypothetical protein